MSEKAFALRNADGSLHYEFRRTPGYPLFVGVLNKLMKIPFNGIIFIQVLLTVLVGLITYKTALEIEPESALLSMVLVLYSPILSIYSLMLITEALFVFLISLFMFYFVKYLKSGETITLLFSALTLVCAVYVRPGGYFLGIVTALFIFQVKVHENIKKAILHSFIFLVVVYGLLGLWQVRNLFVFGNPEFSSILHSDPANFGLYNSYLRNKDIYTQGMGPVQYYINVTWRCFLSLMTRPGSLKYFHCQGLTAFEKGLGYLWVSFWMSGLLYGITKTGRNRYYQFFMLVIIYFVCGSIMSEMWLVGERLRVPIVPFIAILSAYGWIEIISLIKSRRTPRIILKQIFEWMTGREQIKKILKRLFLTTLFIAVVTTLGFLIWIQNQYVVPIMMYHSVSLADESPLNVVSPKSFANQMEYLKKHEYKIISLDDYVERNKAKKEFPHKTVVITFDDGYRDNYKNAFPIIKQYHFPVTIFLISDYVGVNLNLLTWNQVKEMAHDGIEFGSHTRHHMYLPEATDEQLKDEIIDSKRIIEEHLNKPVNYIAYPSGGFSEQIKGIVALAGYKAALTTNRGYDRYNIDLYELSRIRINNGDNGIILWFKLSGYYNLFRKLRPSH